MNSWWAVAGYLAYGGFGIWLLWKTTIDSPAPGIVGFVGRLMIAFLAISFWPALVVAFYIQAARKGRRRG